ncbi:unnamed protein product [Symbiodinium sp. CCMP2592]|nr:unnamed protein product [Symbiodinium sp. CCMP2592]
MWQRMEKAACLQALKDEYERLGRPLARLQYTGREAKEHVRNLMSGESGPGSGGSAATPKASAPDAAVAGAIVPYTEEEEAGEEPVPETTYSVAFIEGVWYILQHLHGEAMGQMALPEIASNGQGYWALCEHEGVFFVHQGLDNIPVSDFFAEAAGSAGGTAGTEGDGDTNVVSLPGMTRVPDDGDSEEEEEGLMDGEVLEFPYIQTAEDGLQVLHTENTSIPLPEGVTWVLQQHPETQEWFVDDCEKGLHVKPRYVSTLEKRAAKQLESEKDAKAKKDEIEKKRTPAT